MKGVSSMNFAKKLLPTLIVLSAQAALAAAIEVSSVRQNWPWDTRVVIDYTITGDEGKTYDVDVDIDSPEGKIVSWSGAFEGETANLKPGVAHRLVWHPEKATNEISKAAVGMKFKLSCKEAPTPGRYLVMDFADSDNYTVSYLDDIPAGGWGSDYRRTKMAFRRIRPGLFMMGSPSNEEGHIDDRTNISGHGDRLGENLHQVLLTNDFWIGVYAVTGSQIENLDDRTTRRGGKEIAGGTVNWYNVGANVAHTFSFVRLFGANGCANWPNSTDADPDSVFGQVRSKLDGKGVPEGFVLALPTEAQWEYACRAGTTTAWNNGTDCVTNSVGIDVNLDLLGRYGPSASKTYPGQYLPNRWGLYDMHGNMFEVVMDIMSYRFDSSSVVEPRGPKGNSGDAIYRVIRGGGCVQAVRCRSAAREHSNQNAYKTGPEKGGSTGARFAFIRKVENSEWK